MPAPIAGRIARYLREASALEPRVHVGVRRKAIQQVGTESLLSMLVSPLVPKSKKRSFQRAMFKYFHEPIRKTDMTLGQIAHDVTRHVTPFENLFKHKDTVPWKKGFQKEIERPTLTAPLAKAREVAVPLVIGLELEKRLRKNDQT